MPYGLPAEVDTPENNAKMERCVRKVQGQNRNMPVGSAVAICKDTLGFTKRAVAKKGGK